MARLTLTFFGSLQASLNGKPLTILRAARIQALLTYLVLEAERAHTREALAGLFWPDEREQVARQNLRQALYQLRQALGEPSIPYLLVTRDTVQFNPISDYELDVAKLIHHLQQEQRQAAVELYPGDLLTNLTRGSDRFEEWLLLRREQLHILVLDALHQLTEQSLAQADVAQAQRYARRQLALEPWCEAAHRQLMLALAAAGDRSAALVQAEICRRVLADELGVEPDVETKALVAQIRKGDLRSQSGRTVPSTIDDLQNDSAPLVASAVDMPSEEQSSNIHQSLVNQKSKIFNQTDWGDAPDVGRFYGRKHELDQLKSWATGQRCRLIAVLGMGGMGKTTLAARLVRQSSDQFDFVIWRSLLNAPTLRDLLDGWLHTLSDQQLMQMPGGLDAQLTMLFDYLRKQRCLLVLDNAESIMQSGERAGFYRAGYEEYGQLLLRIGQSGHQSCLLLTSREQPREIARLEADTPLVRTLLLTGLDATIGCQLLQAHGLLGSSASLAALVERYSGNPLALKLVADTIQDVFAGDIDALLGDSAPIFDDIRDVLDQQFARLAGLERDILLWLAVEREPLAEAQLWQAFARTTTKRSFLEALRSLLRRSLLENVGDAFGLQNVVTEYLTDYLVTAVCQEFDAETPTLLHSHALIKAQAQEYVRQSQQRIILQPIGARLLVALGQQRLEEKFKRLLAITRDERPGQPSFLAGNLLNLLLHLAIDVRGYDFSRLSVWQAYLRGADLPAVDFSHASLVDSIFTDYLGAVMAVAVSPDGQLLAAGVDNGAIYLWQLASRQLVGVCRGHQGHISMLDFSPDGGRLVSASDDQTARIWDVNTRQTLHTLVGHTGGVASAKFHPDGTVVASGSADETARLWHAATGQLLHILHEHSDMVVTLAFSPDGAILATGSYDQTVRLWDWRRIKVLHTLRSHTGTVRAVAFRPRLVPGTGWDQGGRVLLVSGSYDQTLCLWDAQSGTLLGRLTGHSAPVISVAFSADGAWLMSGSDDQTVRVWDVSDPGRGQTIRILHGHDGAVVALAVHPQRTGAQKLLVSGSYDKTVRLWDVRGGHTLAILRGHAKWLQALVFTPDHRLLVGGSDGQNVRVWDGRSGRVLHTLRGHTGQTEKLALRADGAQLASASWDKTARIWDLGRGQTAPVLQVHPAAVVAVVIGQDAHGRSLIATGSLDHTVRVWDGKTGQALACWHGHHDRIVALAFHPAGIMLASGSWDRTIGLWDAQSGELVRFLQGHSAPIECVAFHPNGELVASGSWDGNVRIWEVGSGQTRYTWHEHVNGLEMVTFSPNGALLASCACDHLVCVWDVRDGRLLYKLQGHTSWVRCIVFSPDSTQLASGSDDGTVKFWAVTPEGAGSCQQTIAMEDPYTGMKITGATGITDAQKAALKALGAVEEV